MTVALPRLPLTPRALHTTDRPSSTAQWTALGRALELQREPEQRIVSDVFAPVFLSGSSRRALAVLRAGGGAVRMAERSTPAGLAASALCRHRFLDERMLEALPDVAQVVVLGAGYDSRAYRFARAVGSRPFYEVDLAPLSRRKAAIVAAHPDLFGHARIRRVEIDFRTQSLADRLGAAGVTLGAPTFVVWEGVSMYLTRDAVAETLEALARLCGAGSVLAMDGWQHVDGSGLYDRLRSVGERGMGLIGEPIGFAVPPAGMADLLAEHRFTTQDLVTAEAMTSRHATGGRRCDDGMYVLAARLR